MDLATLLGLILTLVIALVQSPYLTAILGVVAVMCLAFSIQNILSAFREATLIFNSSTISTVALIEEILRMATLARKEGVLSLEPQRASIRNPFFRKAVKWISDGFEIQSLKEMLQIEFKKEFSLIEAAIQFFSIMSRLCIGVAAVTFVFSAIEAFRVVVELEKFSAVCVSGLGAVSVPLILGLLVFAPISEKLKKKFESQKIPFQLVSHAIISILEGTSPHFLEEKLKMLTNSTSES